MSLTPDTCITRARHCIETGQPGLAQLYMVRASELIKPAPEDTCGYVRAVFKALREVFDEDDARRALDN